MKRGGKRVQSAGKHRYQFRRHLAFGLVCALTLPMWSTGFSLAADTDSDPVSAYVLEADSTPCAVVGDQQVTDWQWVDEEELLVREDGVWYLSLPGAGPELMVGREALQALLPARLKAVLQEGFIEELELTWDLSAIPEEGAYEGSYPLTAALPEGYQLSDTAPALEVQLELDGAEMYAETADKMKFLNGWYFVARDGSELTSGQLTAAIQGLGTKTTAEIQQWLIDTVLPQRLGGWVPNDTESDPRLPTLNFIQDTGKTDMFYETTADGKNVYSGGAQWGKVLIDGWRNFPTSYQNGDSFTIQAYTETKNANGLTYRLFVNSNDPDDYKDDSSGNDTRSNPNILNLTVTLWDIDPADHIVSPASPDNVVVNLFDYWVKTKVPTSDTNGDILDKSDWHIRPNADSKGDPIEGETNMAYSTVRDWNKGINAGHLLLFGDGVIHGGLWNKGAGESTRYGNTYAGMEGIVKKTLAADGYPEINLPAVRGQLTEGPAERDYTLVRDYLLSGTQEDTLGTSGNGNPYPEGADIRNLSENVIDLWEQANGKNITDPDARESLAYLFDPTDNAHKTSYANVSGLFQLDSQGYYYYNMRQNFAEFEGAPGENKGNNRFVLYDAPATVRTDGAKSVGNFFPFNKGYEVFNGVDEKGKLTSSVACSGNAMNHHLGMTVNINFRQPANGKINTGTHSQPMTFGFSGDDDVWVFIDDVLVLDMGGIHSEIYGTIDFSTGKVHIGRAFGVNGIPEDPSNSNICVVSTDLKTLYRSAGKESVTQWRDNTFASNTSHTLKMFYLERGNYDSSLALRFNLQPLLYQRIQKVDQDGKPISGVNFELYPAVVADQNTPGALSCLYTDSNAEGGKPFYVKQDTSAGNDPLVRLTTNDNGAAQFLQTDGSYFNFADRGDQYYILREVSAASGYRKQPLDLVLRYDTGTGMLSVANRWTTGAYACSVSNVIGPPQSENSAQETGLVVAVPMLQKRSGGWLALYGSNLSGFNSKSAGDKDDAGAILLAALKQAQSNAADWHLDWDSDNNRLMGTLMDLPGLGSRYQLLNKDGDMHMTYGLISAKALQKLGITGDTPAQRYAALYNYLGSHTVEETCKTIQSIQSGFALLEMGEFNRTFRSLIYIPNERRELWVQKIDENGKPLKGAEFGLYTAPDCSGDPVAKGTTGADGMLIFSPNAEHSTAGHPKSGHAEMIWANSDNTHYYLKEITAPGGYKVNETVIPVVVGIYSIYADAGEKDDNVVVMAGVGRLTQAMRQYAMDGDVDITLQDITAFMQTQPSGSFSLTGWNDEKLAETETVRSMNLHFGQNAEVDYGLHDQDGGKMYKPFFITDTGFIRTRVEQNQNTSRYETKTSDTNKDDLGSADITNLFSLLNIVVVTDVKDPTAPPDPAHPEEPTGRLTIGKTVTGNDLEKADHTKLFSFTVTLMDSNNDPLGGEYQYSFYGEDKTGRIASGGTLLLHHDESVTILGLPAGTRYTVTEGLADNWTVSPGREQAGVIAQEGNAVAAFTNAKSYTRPDEPDGPEEPEKPTPSPTPTPTSTPTGTPGPSPTPGVTPVPTVTPTPEPTPTAAPPTETPTYPTELPDPNDPDSPEVITIEEEEGVPKTYVKVWNPETEEWEYIDEEDVPLWSAVPETGEGSSPVFWAILVALSLGGLSVLTLPRRKRGGRRLRRNS